MKYLILFPLVFFSLSCQTKPHEIVQNEQKKTVIDIQKNGYETAYFAAGCFWCVEAIFESVEGVIEAESGYSGGEIKDPGYKLICTGTTRHAESVKVIYDPKIVSYNTLLKVFFGSHDPSTKDRQGPDAGPQYRSIAFYQNEQEQKEIKSFIKDLEAKGITVTTDITPFDIFYKAEDYHQDYERNHPENPYVQSVSVPRLKKFQKKYPELLKKKH